MTDKQATEGRGRIWDPAAFAIASQAKSLSGDKLESLVRRLQRHTGYSREACWRFIIQRGLKASLEHRRWTEEEIDQAREDLTKHSVEEVAKKLKRTPKALRCALQRNDLRIRDIRCDCFSIETIARLLHVRKDEVISWINQGWLQASIRETAARRFYTVTPEAFASLYRKHLQDLLKSRRVSNTALFEAFYQYCYTPKHTVGEQLLDVRRDKRERAAYASLSADPGGQERESDVDEMDDVDAEEDVDCLQ